MGKRKRTFITKDILLVHIPVLTKNLDSKIFYSSMGLFSLCNELCKNDIKSEIIHLGVEFEIDKKFSIINYIIKNNYKIIAFSLSWYQQLYDTLEIIKLVKKSVPLVKTIVGGYTASCFAKELIEKFDCIDFVIKGEGEIPIVELSKYLLKKTNKKIEQIPNIFYRKNNKYEISKKIWVANNIDLNSFDFSKIELMKNYKKYLELTNKISFTCIRRGCPGNCSWCGAGKDAQKKINNRKTVSLRNSNVVAKEIVYLYEKYNLSHYINFDPYPKKQQYLVKIFEEIGKKFPKQIKITFDCYGLPTKELIKSMKKNLSDESCFVISPDFATNNLRKLHNTHKFTNKQLFKILDYIELKEVYFCIYFAKFPNEQINETILRNKMIEFIREKYKMVGDINTIQLDFFPPYAPISINPPKYNIQLPIFTFEDYYKYV